jgi:hypothetical protein
MDFRLDRNALEGLRDLKRSRNFYRLASTTVVQHEYRGKQFGHPSTYAFVRFECAPADDLSFESRASWPSTVLHDEQTQVEQAIAESVADALLSGLYQHSGCAVTLADVRWDDVCSGVASFMRATNFAMQDLLAAEWTVIVKKRK